MNRDDIDRFFYRDREKSPRARQRPGAWVQRLMARSGPPQRGLFHKEVQVAMLVALCTLVLGLWMLAQAGLIMWVVL